jgi:ubiquinone/menaquinone biosynthesis C-methylase UbiE
MNNILTKEPIRKINGVLDYIGEEARDNTDYIDNYEDMAADRSYLASVPSTEIEVILNCCELTIDMLRLAKPIDNIIDIGCGFGHVLNQIKKTKLTVGVDISFNRLSNLNDDVTKVRALAEELPFKSESFDLAILTDIFEHVQDEKLLVAEVLRILKPGGTLLFACPWEQDLSVYDLKEYKEKFVDYKYKHLRSVDEVMIQDNFSDFEMISSTQIVSHMKKMLFKPYSVRFIIFKKDES